MNPAVCSSFGLRPWPVALSCRLFGVSSNEPYGVCERSIFTKGIFCRGLSKFYLLCCETFAGQNLRAKPCRHGSAAWNVESARNYTFRFLSRGCRKSNIKCSNRLFILLLVSLESETNEVYKQLPKIFRLFQKFREDYQIELDAVFLRSSRIVVGFPLKLPESSKFSGKTRKLPLLIMYWTLARPFARHRQSALY